MLKHLLLTACCIGLAAPALAGEGGNLAMADNTQIEANWEMHSDDAYLGARSGCYESLTRVTNAVTIEPALATGWTQTGPTTWEFQIRDGVSFQNGSPLDAAAVAGALTHLLNATVPARAFSTKTIEKVEATGPMTVTITTVEPVVTLPGRLAAPATAILAPAAYEGDAINPIGTCTGPFEITEVDRAQHITVERFDGYWGEKPKLAGGQVRFIPDANTRGTMARTGEVQIARLVPPAMVEQLKGNADLELHEVKAPRILELLLNNGRAPFDDTRVRQAVKLAIDTAGISAAVYEGYAPPAGDPFRAGEPWEAPNAPAVTRDLERARGLLAEAGVDPGALNLSLLAYTSKTELRDISEIIQAMLGEIGIKVEVRLAEYGALEPDMMSGNYDMALMSRGYLTDVPEPIGFLTADYSCDGGFNISQFCEAEMDERLAAAAAEPDAETRYGMYADIAQTLYDDAVTVYLVNETVFDVASKGVANYEPHPLNYYSFVPALGVE